MSSVDRPKRADDETDDLIYKALLHAPFGAVVASTSAAGEILFVNRDFTAITGYTHADVPSVAVWLEQAYPDPAYRSLVMANWARDVSEPGRDVVYRVTCRDGIIKDILLRAGLLPSERMVVTMLDVSDRQRFERELRQSEQRFRALAETVDQVFWIYQVNPEAILYASPAFETIWGRSVEELYADPHQWFAAVLPDDLDETLAKWRACIRGESSQVQLEYRIRRPDGTTRWIEDSGAAVVDERGRVVRINGVAKDATKRKRMEEALEESEARHRALVDTMPTGLAVHAQGRIRYANRALLDMLGISDVHETLDRPILEFVHPEDHAATGRRIAALHKDGGSVGRDEVRFVRPDGEILEVETSGAVIEWRGEPAVQVVVTDISERRRAERERRDLDERVQRAQKVESLEVLAGGVAHDFNNLLTGILGGVGLALDELPHNSLAQADLETIELSARRAADLARQMLAYAGCAPFGVECLDLCALVEDIAPLIEATVSKKVRIEYALDADTPIVEADVTQLRQVLLNLVTNASEAMDERDGRIAIATGVTRLVKDELDEEYQGAELTRGLYAFIEVSDNGAGMDPETRRRIFDPFFTTKFAGRGLGLAAVLGILKSHRCAIRVESEVGAGATFRILLPAVADPDEVELAPESKVSHSTNRATVLLVDDEESVRSVVSRMLKRNGCDVVTAQDGRAAVSLFAECHTAIDCVILDLAMPHMGGREALRELRRIRPDVPVLLSSGCGELSASDGLEDELPIGFLPKPYTRADLQTALSQLLGN